MIGICTKLLRKIPIFVDIYQIKNLIMLENIINLVKEQAGSLIASNDLIPNDKNELATNAASESFMDVIKSKISGGDLSGLTQMFQGGNTEGIAGQIQDAFTQKLGGLGIGPDAAQQAAGSLIPTILSGVISKISSGNFDFQSLLSQFAGADGKFDLNDVGNLLGGSSEEGGILGKIKGLF